MDQESWMKHAIRSCTWYLRYKGDYNIKEFKEVGDK